MKKENSIKLLKKQIDKLGSDALDERHWKDETANLVSNIFGKDSEQLVQIKNISVSIDTYIVYGEKHNPLKNRQQAARYLESFIVQVENFENKKHSEYDPREEYKLSKNLVYFLIPIILGFISGAFFLGQSLGQTRFDQEKIEMSEQIRALSIDTSNLAVRIKQSDSMEITLNRQLLIKSDSIKELSDDLNSLYLYLGSISK